MTKPVQKYNVKHSATSASYLWLFRHQSGLIHVVVEVHEAGRHHHEPLAHVPGWLIQHASVLGAWG